VWSIVATIVLESPTSILPLLEGGGSKTVNANYVTSTAKVSAYARPPAP
jgi:hypothetical protein